MRFIIPVLAVLAVAGCNQKAVEDLAACQTEKDTITKTVDQMKTDLATATAAKVAAEQKVTALETQVKEMVAAAEAAKAPEAGKAAAPAAKGAAAKKAEPAPTKVEAVKKAAEAVKKGSQNF